MKFQLLFLLFPLLSFANPLGDYITIYQCTTEEYSFGSETKKISLAIMGNYSGDQREFFAVLVERPLKEDGENCHPKYKGVSINLNCIPTTWTFPLTLEKVEKNGEIFSTFKGEGVGDRLYFEKKADVVETFETQLRWGRQKPRIYCANPDIG